MNAEILYKKTIKEFIPKQTITAISRGKVVSIPICDINHVSKSGNETVIYSITGDFRTYHSLQDILNDLPVNDFYRIHKSHVIAIKFMDGMKRDRIRVEEDYLPVSKYYKAEIIKRLTVILDKAFIFFEKP